MATEPTPQPRRQLARIPFDAAVTLVDQRDAQRWRSSLLDMCLKGALLARPNDWRGRPGDRYWLEILLTQQGPVIRIDARVAHAEDDRIGVTWLHLDGDSAAHLRRLVELNAGDGQLFDRDFAQLIKPR